MTDRLVFSESENVDQDTNPENSSIVSKISAQINPSNMNDENFGYYSSMKSNELKNPTHTRFRRLHNGQSRFTNYIMKPINVKVEQFEPNVSTSIKLYRKDYNVVDEVCLYIKYKTVMLSYCDCIEPCECVRYHDASYADFYNCRVSLKKYNLVIFDHSLGEIINILKMYPEEYANSINTKDSNYVLFKVPLFHMLDLKHFSLSGSPLEVIISPNKYLSSVELYCNGYIFAKDESHSEDVRGKEYMCFQYDVVECPVNQKFNLDLSNNIIIDKMLVSGNFTDVIFTDGDFSVNMMSSKSSHNLFKNECGNKMSDENTFYYFCKNDDVYYVDGKLFPSETKSIFIKSNDKNVSTAQLYIRFQNILYMSSLGLSENANFIFSKDSYKKEKLYKKYRSCIKNNQNLEEIITEIKENTNTYPLTRQKCCYDSSNSYYEGYWFDEMNENSDYPIPIVSDENSTEFLTKMENYMKSSPAVSYFGSSMCRICDKHNGGSEFTINHKDIKISFPNGLLHYYADHNVKPSAEFYEAIMSTD